MKHATNEGQRTSLGGWEDDGGAPTSEAGQATETSRQEDSERNAARAVFDATHESSARGEHRYGDAQQTPAEQKARQARDELKQKLGRTRFVKS